MASAEGGTSIEVVVVDEVVSVLVDEIDMVPLNPNAVMVNLEPS